METDLWKSWRVAHRVAWIWFLMKTFLAECWRLYDRSWGPKRSLCNVQGSNGWSFGERHPRCQMVRLRVYFVNNLLIFFMWNTYIFINNSELIVILEIDIKSYQYLEFFGVATNFDITQDLSHFLSWLVPFHPSKSTQGFAMGKECGASSEWRWVQNCSGCSGWPNPVEYLDESSGLPGW